MPFQVTAVDSTRECEIQPRKLHCGVDLFSDVLPFGHFWYGEPKAVRNAIAWDEARKLGYDGYKHKLVAERRYQEQGRGFR